MMTTAMPQSSGENSNTPTPCRTHNLSYDTTAFIAGALLTLAFAPFSYWPMAIISPAALLICLHGWPSSSQPLTTRNPITPRRGLWRGWLFGVGFFTTGVSWVYISIHVYGHTPALLAAFFTALFITTIALFFALQTYLYKRCFPSNTTLNRLLAFPSLWVVMEYLRTWLFTGFPWLLLGYSQIDTPLRGYGPILGVYGLSFLTVFTAAILVNCLYLIVSHRSSTRRTLAVTMVTLTLVWFSGILLTPIPWTHAISKPLTVTLIQGNIPQEIKWRPGSYRHALDVYRTMTKAHWDSDLIVWPEAAIPAPHWVVADELQALGQMAKQHHTALLLGIPMQADSQQHYYNSIVAYGTSDGRYAKRHLVPFGEYLPIESLRGIIDFFDIPMSNFIPGPKQQTTFTINSSEVAGFICYEIIYPDEVLRDLPGANLLVTVSDDSWFGDSIAADQHLEMGQMRALETGRTVLFATNNGITAIINPQGQLTQRLPRDLRTTLTDQVLPYAGATPFVRFGQLPIMLLIGGLLIVAFIARRPQ